MRFFHLCVLLLVWSSPALADCNVDCNAKCCHWVRITPWDKNKICSPDCKITCEAEKTTCQLTGGTINIRISPNVLKTIINALEDSCAAGFQIVTNAVVMAQGTYSMGSDNQLYQARDLLIRAGIYSADAFNNVTIRWCTLADNTFGMTPDRNLICIYDRPPQTLAQTAITLAHEMKHVEQYRRMGTDSFKCAYSKEFVKCGGCYDARNPYEAEAYKFEEQVSNRIIQYAGQNGGGNPTGGGQPRGGFVRCYTPYKFM